MKKLTVAMAVSLLCCAILTGCGNAAESAVPEDNSAPVSSEEAAAGKSVEADSPNEAKPSDTPDDKASEEPKVNDKDEAASVTAQSDDDKSDTEEPEPAKKDRRELYQEILYKYKEAQDGMYSEQQLEEAGLSTELIQHGWPIASAGDVVRYLYYDVDGDGEDELIITYYDSIVDIYGYDGEKVRLAFSTPYRGITNLYPDGMLCMIFAITASDYNSTWYQYDTSLGDYFAVFENRYEQDAGDEYYTFCYYDLSAGGRKELEDTYRKYDDYPVWIGEWMDQIDKDEYEKLLPKTSEIKLPKGELLSGVKLPADYKPMIKDAGNTSAGTDGGEQKDTGGEKLEITKDVQKKLNIFLSNFAEQGMNSYDYGHPDMYGIGYFAFRWSYLNRYKDVKIDGDHYSVSFDVVKNLADRYLGLAISRADLEGYEMPDKLHEGFFKNGDYYIPAADGESYPGFAVAQSAEDLGEGKLRIEFTVYDLDLELYWDMDKEMMQKFYSLTPEEAVAKTAVNEYGTSQITATGRGYAIVLLDGDSYKLRYYELYE